AVKPVFNRDESPCVSVEPAVYGLLERDIDGTARWGCDMGGHLRVINIYEFLIGDLRAQLYLFAGAVKAPFSRNINRMASVVHHVSHQVAPKSLKRFVLEFQHHPPAPGVCGHKRKSPAPSVSLFDQKRSNAVFIKRAVRLQYDRSAGLRFG